MLKKFMIVMLSLFELRFVSFMILLIVSDCIGLSVSAAVSTMKDGDVILLDDPVFARELSKVADLYVNDAFGTANRAHASTEGVTSFLSPSVAGLLLQKEMDYLQNAVNVLWLVRKYHQKYQLSDHCYQKYIS
jgi:3-phosphoglycerate kinase